MSSSSAVVCREIFDENSQPSAEEISDYAQTLGIDPVSESHLLPLARDGLMQALPPPWKAYFNEKIQNHYYYNEETKKTQWEHPLDPVYRELVRRARDTSIHDDTYVSVQELPTSEENTKHLEQVEPKPESEDDDLSTDSGDNQSSRGIKDIAPLPRRLTPLGRPPLAPLRALDKLSDIRISPLRRSVDSSLTFKAGASRTPDRDMSKLDKPKLSKQQSEIIDLKMNVLTRNEEENYSLFVSGKGEKVFKGLPLTGKGSMFLKNKKPDLASPDTDKSVTQEFVTRSDPVPKGILREKLDPVQRKVESLSLALGKPKPLFSTEEDRKSVRFKLEGTPLEPAASPSSNSSSEPNEEHSIISGVSVPPPHLLSPPPANTSSNMPTVSAPPADTCSNMPTLAPIVLSPIVPRLPLPPRPAEDVSSPRDSSKGSEKDGSESPRPRRRRVVRPPAGDYIKQDLFQKSFHKIADLLRPAPADAEAAQLTESDRADKELRPRSPLIPQVNKISINLMESIESETSIDSPDREFANLDLNDMDTSKDDLDENTKENNLVTYSIPKPVEEKYTSEFSNNSSKHENSNIPNIPQIKIPRLPADFLAKPPTRHQSESEESKTSPKNESKNPSKSDSFDMKILDPKVLSPTVKISPNHSFSSDLRSPRSESYLSSFKPSPTKAVITQVKISNSNTSLRGAISPRLDGVTISQGKGLNGGSDNVVVMYQFEQPNDDDSSKSTKSEKSRDIERKGEEKRRLESDLQKEMEDIRIEWAVRERRLRAELQQELKQNEERFQEEKKMRLLEQAERHRKEMEEALRQGETRHRADLESMERQHAETAHRLREEWAGRLDEERTQLELENERTINEHRQQLMATANRERSRMLDEHRSAVETLRAEHTARLTELRHDYRAEVERLRSQHAAHLQELRARLASSRAAAADTQLQDKYRCLKEKYARLKHDVKMSIERRNKRREMSMTTGSETEKSNSHKATQSLDRCKELNESLVTVETQPARAQQNNNATINESSLSESNAQRSRDNNNHDWRPTIEASASPSSHAVQPRRTTVVFREPPRKRDKHRDRETAAATDYQDSSDATTADDKHKDSVNGRGRRRCFTRLKSASTSRLNYSPKRGDGWASPLEALRQQLRKLDDLEEQFPDLACQPAYSLRYPFAELGGVSSSERPELEFVRHRALVEREGMRRARAALRRRRAALLDARLRQGAPVSAAAVAAADDDDDVCVEEERETTELEVALHRARALLGEKEIRLQHIERALRRLAGAGARAEAGTPAPAVSVVQLDPPSCSSASSSCSDGGGGGTRAARGAVLRSLRALHADVRDIWRALDATRHGAVSPANSSCIVTSPQPRTSTSADASRQDPDGVAERARGLRAWLHAAP